LPATRAPIVALAALAAVQVAACASRPRAGGAGQIAPLNGALPTDNPVARYGLAWTNEIRWNAVVSIHDFPGATVDRRLEAAQRALVERGGGVVFFPAGTYRFADHVRLPSGVVLRGQAPTGVVDARQAAYLPPARFEFPAFRPRFEGDGTPIDSAFKGIMAAAPATTSNIGVVNIAIDHGHVAFDEEAPATPEALPSHRVGRNRLVYGCRLTNAAGASKKVPDLALGHHAWQRHTDPFRAAIHVYASENMLIANNRLHPSDASFLMPGFAIPRKDQPPYVPEAGVLFDYDNRYGIAANNFPLGGPGHDLPDGTPETHPHGFRRGAVIRDNFVHSTGRVAIAFTGDGTVCSGNVIRFLPGLTRYTTNGTNVTSASSTNDNRAIQIRGWRWRVEDNDYEVYRNRSANPAHHINDGEGLMHEDHCNSSIKDSVLARNRGNAYISIWHVGEIDGLLVEGNSITTAGGQPAIYVAANRGDKLERCRNVSIIDNLTKGTGILLACAPSENNVIRGNRHQGPMTRLRLDAEATVAGNSNYEIGPSPPKRTRPPAAAPTQTQPKP
jgi:hypothetical protein